jgi:magnesium transporter
MLEIRRSTRAGLERPTAPCAGCWLHITQPAAADLASAREFGVPASLLDHVSDIDERPRVEHLGECVLVVMNYPLRRDGTSGPPWRTLPLSVLLTPQGIVTVSQATTPFLQPLLDGHVQGLSTDRGTEFVLRVFWQLADACLRGLREINAGVEGLENELKRSIRNEEVLGLLDFQKSLTYFATGLKANELVLERLQRVPTLHWADQDQELLDDVRVELRQAIEMVEIADHVLSDMMDAFASIVSNNLNSVMKVLTSVTIILAVPTLIASVYGMNVGLPGAHSPLAFAGIVALSVAICGGLFFVFRRRNWL